MTAFTLLGAAVLVAALLLFRFRTAALRSSLVAAAAAVLVVTTFASASVAGATTTVKHSQAKLRITNTTRATTIGTTIKVRTAGGSGPGVVRFTASGTACSVGAASGVLNASVATKCVVVATKAASAHYKKTTSALVAFTFNAVVGPESPSYITPDKASLVTSSWSTTGLDGTGPVNDTTNGFNWFIDAYYSPTDKWLYAYVTPGATVNLTWLITGSNGQRLADTAVTLQTQFAPGANNGAGDTDATFSATGMNNGALTGVTNSLGLVTFSFVNTNASAAPAPTGWNSNAVSSASGVAAGTTVADVAAEKLESGAGYAWTRMALVVGSDVITANPAAPTVNEATDLVDVIVAANA